MNIFTERSIELANQHDYFDQLFSVYPLSPDNIREIDPCLWESIRLNFEQKNYVELFKDLLELKLFPIKDGYVPFFKRYRKGEERDRIIRNNPKTVRRICGRIFELGLDKLYENCTQPKETNRQMGPIFRRWVESGVLGVMPVTDVEEFLNCEGLAILSGTDTFLANFARKYLGWERADKGPDFIAKNNGKYIIGEAKFITDFGGHQNDQFNDALATLESKTAPDVVLVAIIDGVVYIPNNGKLYQTVIKGNRNIMSALMLHDFIYSL